MSQTDFQVFEDVEEQDSDAVKVARHLGVGDLIAILHCADDEFPDSVSTSILDWSEDLRDFAGGWREMEDALLSGWHLDLHEERLLGVDAGAVDFDLYSVGQASLLNFRQFVGEIRRVTTKRSAKTVDSVMGDGVVFDLEISEMRVNSFFFQIYLWIILALAR